MHFMSSFMHLELMENKTMFLKSLWVYDQLVQKCVFV
jgi:hypothetical protein